MKLKHLLFLFLILYIVNFSFLTTFATIRYVSKAGTSTPPYTSWQTAADSIQKCINYSLDGDTIIVANGVYKESLIVNKYLWLIGSSIDSTVIDGTGMADMTIDFQSDGFIQNLWTKGKGYGIPNTTSINVILKNVGVYKCKITDSYVGIGLVWSSSIIDQCIITNVIDGYATYCDIDTCEPIIKNTIINLNNDIGIAIVLGTGGNLTLNNTLLGNNNGAQGIKGVFNPRFSKIINNNILAFRRNIEASSYDTTILENNISSYASERGYTINSMTNMRNNIAAYNETGTVGPTTLASDYNLYWNNNKNTTEGIAEHDIKADPMFVNDTIPVYDGTYDYHLQMYSPALDAGDPTILDVDGSRSDIGMYGGPGGESYTYQNLAPKPPQNFQAIYNNSTVEIKWDKHSEADFSHYNIYRSAVDGFEPGYSSLYSSSDTSYFEDSNTAENEKLYYRITALDSADNESVPGEQISVTITGEDEGETEIVKEFRLYQNFPNPFNPTTTIPFKIKERGYVKVMVYDIKGEILTTLVNEAKEAGYYEVKFNGSSLASGIYLYRIEVIGEGNIPVFVDMKKIMLVK